MAKGWTPPGWVPPEGEQRPDTAVRVPHDPVLRLVLMRLGVITPEDIARGETEFLAIVSQEVKADDVPGRPTQPGN